MHFCVVLSSTVGHQGKNNDFLFSACVLSIGEYYDNITQQLCLQLMFSPINLLSIFFLEVSWAAVRGQ